MKILITKVKRAAIIGALLLGASGTPSRAQEAGGMPDLSDFAGAIAKSAQAAPKKPAANAKFKSSMPVPSVEPGEGARAIGRKLREVGEANGGPVEALKQLEDAMPAVLKALEEAFEKNGVAKRDMGVAYGYVFIDLYENATGKTVPEAPSKVAMRTLGTAISQHWGTKFNALDPAVRENLYESLIMSTTLNTLLTKQFAEAKKDEEVASMRKTSADLFEQLVGVPPAQVKFAANGQISGLAPAQK